MPLLSWSWTTVFEMKAAALAVLLSMLMPRCWKPEILQFSTVSMRPDENSMPKAPVPNPTKSRPRRKTLSVAPAATVIALPVVTRMPASTPVASIVIALGMVTAPKSPGSNTLISPPAAVLTIAPLKVRHGAVRLQGFASSPTPDTKVRLACALNCAAAKKITVKPTATTVNRILNVPLRYPIFNLVVSYAARNSGPLQPDWAAKPTVLLLQHRRVRDRRINCVKQLNHSLSNSAHDICGPRPPACS